MSILKIAYIILTTKAEAKIWCEVNSSITRQMSWKMKRILGVKPKWAKFQWLRRRRSRISGARLWLDEEPSWESRISNMRCKLWGICRLKKRRCDRKVKESISQKWQTLWMSRLWKISHQSFWGKGQKSKEESWITFDLKTHQSRCSLNWWEAPIYSNPIQILQWSSRPWTCSTWV